MSEFFRKLNWMANRSRKEEDLNDEIRFHLEEEAELRRERGADFEQARRGAHQELGNVTRIKEDARAAWTWTFLERLGQDLRYAVRGLKNNPGFTATAVLSLAMGLGTSLAIYTVADNLLLRPLPYYQPSQLVMLTEAKPAVTDALHLSVAPRNYFAWKARSDVFQDIVVFSTGYSVLGDGERTEEFSNISAQPGLLKMLGVQPAAGQLFAASSGTAAAEPVIMISYRLWQSWFGGDRGVVGKQVRFSGKTVTIIGVLPASFYFLDRKVDIWTPLALTVAANAGEGRYLNCLARLKPDTTIRQAQSQITAIMLQREIDDPRFNKGSTATVEPLRDALVRTVKPSLLVLMGAVCLLLAVACANVASLLLARYSARQREIALRASLGAGRLRVIRQLLTESLLLAFIGGTLGMLLANRAVAALVYLAPKDLTQSIEIAIDIRVYLFAFGLTALTSILFGLAPALASAQGDGRSGIGTRGNLRGWFVGAEIALSVILLSGALLLFRSLEGLQNVNPGIRAENLLTARVSLPGARYSKPIQSIQFFERAAQEIRALPGVRETSTVSHLPFNGKSPGTNVAIEGNPPAKPGEELIARIRTVGPGYFHTMGIPLIRGREFSETDNRLEAPYRFIVSESFARQYLTGANPMSRKISVAMDMKNPYGEIIGVAGDVRDQTLDQEPRPTVYYPHAHLTYNRMTLLVRTRGDAMSLAPSIAHVVRGIDPAQPVADIKTMETIISDTFSRQHFSTLLLGGFSVASLLLAAIGVYGILAYSVSGRVREFGVRVAVGATPAGIMSLVFRSAAFPVAGGVAVGLGGALMLSGLLSKLLFGIGPRDPLTFTLVPVVLALVALMAAWVPSRRAAQLDPADALRAN